MPYSRGRRSRDSCWSESGMRAPKKSPAETGQKDKAKTMPKGSLRSPRTAWPELRSPGSPLPPTQSCRQPTHRRTARSTGHGSSPRWCCRSRIGTWREGSRRGPAVRNPQRPAVPFQGVCPRRVGRYACRQRNRWRQAQRPTGRSRECVESVPCQLSTQLPGFRARSHELRGFCRAGHAVAPVGTKGHTDIQPSALRWVNRVVSLRSETSSARGRARRATCKAAAKRQRARQPTLESPVALLQSATNTASHPARCTGLNIGATFGRSPRRRET